MNKPPSSSNFSIDNLPYGIFSTPHQQARVGVAYQDRVIDLYQLGQLLHWDFDIELLQRPFLNDFIALGKKQTQKVRIAVKQWIKQVKRKNLINISTSLDSVKLHLPLQIGDYTDFYSSQEHATNVGKLFRDPQNALLPNWKHLPVAYHGRASTIIESGKPIHRPKGQILKEKGGRPTFGPTEKLDFELELGCVIGKENSWGKSVSINEASEYIFGVVLCNDWSARDIQQWEYVPLGPFLGKSFATSISPWVVPIEVLAPFQINGPVQDPPVLDYLKQTGKRNFDIHLEVYIKEASGETTLVCMSNPKYLYWSWEQQIVHHTSNGCQLGIGDLLATGTISGKTPDSYGSLLELNWGGKKPLQLNSGNHRLYLQDYDKIRMRGIAHLDGYSIDFGELVTEILSPL